MPWLSSSAPGPSPTKASRAFGFPTPKTMFFRPEQSLHRSQSPRARRTSSSRGGSPEASVSTGADGADGLRAPLGEGTPPALAGTSAVARDAAGSGDDV